MRVHRASGNDIPLAVLNNQSLNQVFNRTILTDITALPNGVKYYEVSGGNIVQRVQEYELVSGDVINYITTNTNNDIVRLSNTNFSTYINVVNNTSNIVGDDIYTANTIPRNSVTYDSLENVNTIWHGLVGTRNTFISFTKGTYANLAAAQADLAGTQVLYQLATPITIVSGVSITQSQLDYLYQVWQFNTLNALVARQFIQEA
jgi:hypothetical protein